MKLLKSVKLNGSPERNIFDEINGQTEFCSRKIKVDKNCHLRRRIIINSFDNGDRKRIMSLDQSAEGFIPRNCPEPVFLNEADKIELKKNVIVNKVGVNYSVQGTLKHTGMRQVWPKCTICNDLDYSSENDEIYVTAKTCVSCNNCEVGYPTANNSHIFQKHRFNKPFCEIMCPSNNLTNISNKDKITVKRSLFLNHSSNSSVDYSSSDTEITGKRYIFLINAEQ